MALVAQHFLIINPGADLFFLREATVIVLGVVYISVGMAAQRCAEGQGTVAAR